MGKMSKKRATSVGMMSLFGALIMFGVPSGAIGERRLVFREELGGSIIDAPFDLNGDGFTGESFLAAGSGVFGASNINGVVEVVPPRFKGVWPTDANFALLSLPDTRRDQFPRPHKRSDDPPGCHGLPEQAHCPRRSGQASLA